MGTETKVGLLVGLAFIICFAIILANRGQSGVDGPPQPILTTGEPSPSSNRRDTGGLRPSTAARPDGNRGDAALASAERNIPPGKASRVDQAPMGNETSESVPGGGEGFAMSSGASPPVGLAGSRESAPSGETALSAVTQPAGNPAYFAPTRGLQDQQRLLREMLERSSGPQDPSASDNGSVQVPTRVSEGESVHPRTRTADTALRSHAGTKAPAAETYVVRAGDTLSGIAQTVYGSRSPTVIRALVDANRDTLRNPDVVKVGMKLALPAGEQKNGDATPTAQPSREPPRQEPTAVARDGESGIRWYQIRTNDRYASIAREQLGDESRWREIFDLNKDKFPDPHAIREGVRIKLPASPLAAGRQSRP
jgi:nucleoid-associated protein YgaU